MQTIFIVLYMHVCLNEFIHTYCEMTKALVSLWTVGALQFNTHMTTLFLSVSAPLCVLRAHNHTLWYTGPPMCGMRA